jgi:formylglycine-generating enzyme required for sulfatase activity
MQTYYMDVTEVTYAAYKACEAAGDCNRAGPRYRDYDRPEQPMVGANWYDAKMFCEAQGKHLPTEAEWEKAARGPDGHAHPWGDEPATCDEAVIKNASGRSCGIEKQGGQPAKGRTWEVAKKPAGVYGLYDMLGNAEEWVADWYVQDYDQCGEDCAGIDPLGPCGGEEPCAGKNFKMVKGGSWYWPETCAKGFHRRPHFPANEPYHHFGFRCAASAEEASALIAAATTTPNDDALDNAQTVDEATPSTP